ncbi:cytosine permease, partial [Nonomuraea sp. RK-328]|nr:cytosine permease [Nonomuraea sp. RK-328]
VLGALGITLGLSLMETIAVVAVGNLVGCAVFGLFNLMGHRTGVNQMVLGRGAFGRRGAIVPGVVQGLLTMGWVGVNTWVVLVAAWSRQFGMVPATQGPIARALNDTDFSWLSGGLVAGGLYYLLVGRAARRVAARGVRTREEVLPR